MRTLRGIVVVPCRHAPNAAGTVPEARWADGPLPLPWGARVTDADLRSTLLDPRASSLLYGRRAGSERRHLVLDEQTFPGSASADPSEVTLEAVEWLRAPSLGSGVAGLAVLHLHVSAQQTQHLLATWADASHPERSGATWQRIATIVRARAGLSPELGTSNFHAYRIALVDQDPDMPPPFPTSGMSHGMQVAFSAAAGITSEQFVPGPADEEEFQRSSFDLSADWRALVLRDGTTFLVAPSAVDSAFIVTSAPTLVRTVYTDVLMLGMLQSIAMSDFLNDLALLDDPAGSPRAVEELDARFSRIRNALWWQQVSQRGHANELLRLLGHQRRLPEIIAQTTAELEAYSRQTTLRSNRRLTLAVSVFTLLGLVGVAGELFRLYAGEGARPGVVATSIGAALLLAGTVIVLRVANIRPPWPRGSGSRR